MIGPVVEALLWLDAMVGGVYHPAAARFGFLGRLGRVKVGRFRVVPRPPSRPSRIPGRLGRLFSTLARRERDFPRASSTHTR
jgi:hypothetical protein